MKSFKRSFDISIINDLFEKCFIVLFVNRREDYFAFLVSVDEFLFFFSEL